MKIIYNNKSNAIIGMQNPHKRTVLYGKTPHSIKKTVSHFISLPFVFYKLYYHHYQSLHYNLENDKIEATALFVAFAIEEKPKHIYLPPLRNFYTHDRRCRVCLGKESFVEKNPVDLLEKIITAFWNSRFNTGLGLDFIGQSNSNYNSLYPIKKWVLNTKADPNWIPGKNDLMEIDTFKNWVKDF